jgi:REP element-mobilizing transposase RayT
MHFKAPGYSLASRCENSTCYNRIIDCQSEIYKQGNRTFWIKGYYVSIVSNQKTIVKYIHEKEAKDQLQDNMTKQEYINPFAK